MVTPGAGSKPDAVSVADLDEWHNSSVTVAKQTNSESRILN
jgi:hypothetical protein